MEKNHPMHAALIGAGTALVAKNMRSTRKSYGMYGLGAFALSYWYMNKYGHSFPHSSLESVDSGRSIDPSTSQPDNREPPTQVQVINGPPLMGGIIDPGFSVGTPFFGSTGIF